MTEEITTKKGGPTTEEGKETSKRNATRHGIYSTNPVVEDLESKEEWEAHRLGVIESLSPEGHLEHKLAEQVASLMWRRERITRYEKATMSSVQDEVTWEFYRSRRLREAQSRCELFERLPTLEDEEEVSGKEAMLVLSYVAATVSHFKDYEAVHPDKVSLPDLTKGTPLEEYRWTGKTLREALSQLTAMEGHKHETIVGVVRRISKVEALEAKRLFDPVTGVVPLTQEDLDLGELSSRRYLPDEETLEKIVRYEAHLTRQINQSLERLKELQAGR